MPEIDSFDAETRCQVLVGRFLQKWASMEGTMRTAMQVALNLDDFQTAIVASNTQLRDKVHILRTLVSWTPFDQATKKKFDDILVDIRDASPKRNMMAHDAFCPSADGKGVSFSVVKAKGSLSFPDTVWDVTQFEKEYEKIDRLKAGVVELVKTINNKTIIDRMRETAAASWPIESYHRTPLPLVHPTS
jgi:hypothetical protein